MSTVTKVYGCQHSQMADQPCERGCHGATETGEVTVKADHTLTPWQVSYLVTSDRADGQAVAAITAPHPKGGGQTVAEALEVDARFIVKAVNSHDALVEAVKQLLEAYAPNAQKSADEEGEQCLHSSVQRARAALAEAGQ